MLIREKFNLSPVIGEIGIEIEMEGRNLPDRVPYFKRVHDGSLRGPETGEFVLTRPASREEYRSNLESFRKTLEDWGTEVYESYRTSTHIHINVQELNMTEVYNIITLYLMFEEYLVKFCGEHRQGNLFCLRMRDAEALLALLTDCAVRDSYRTFSQEILRYAAINVTSIPKYGSLEFRSMRGTGDMDEIVQWVEILLKLKDAALTYNDPVEIIDEISAIGAEGLAEKVFGEYLETLPLGENWEHLIFENMRDIQTLAFCKDWNNEKTIHPPVQERLRRRQKFDYQVIREFAEADQADQIRELEVQG